MCNLTNEHKCCLFLFGCFFNHTKQNFERHLSLIANAITIVFNGIWGMIYFLQFQIYLHVVFHTAYEVEFHCCFCLFFVCFFSLQTFTNRPQSGFRICNSYKWSCLWLTSLLPISHRHFNGLVQDYSNSIANALVLLQSCTKPFIWMWDST